MMNKYNCDSLKNLPVPDELIEKALVIPATAEKTPVILPWYRRTRMIAAAASIVLVATLGISAFFFFGNKKPPVKEYREAVEPTVIATEEATEPSGAAETQPTINAERSTEPVAKPSETATEAATRSPSGRIVTITTVTTNGVPVQNGNQTAEPEEPAPTSAGRQESPKQSEPTEKAVPKPVDQPTEAQPAIPTERVIEPTTPAVIPTEPPINTASWEFLLAPTGDSGDPIPSRPSGAAYAPPIYAHGTSDNLTGSGTVYLALYDLDGALMGGGELLSEERLMTVIWNHNGKLWLKYIVPPGMLPRSGDYEIRLYNEDGQVIARYADYIVVPA